MASTLATALIAVPYGPNAAGDQIWRNADLTSITWAGIRPTEALFDELLITVGAGEAGHVLSRLVPDADLLAKAISHGSPIIRKGAVSNPLITDAQLAALAADPNKTVAGAADEEIAERATLRAGIASGEREAIVATVRSTRVELIEEMLAHHPEKLTAISPGDQGELLLKLEVLNPRLRDRIALAVIAEPHAYLTATAVKWGLGSVAGETLLATMDQRLLRQRATDVAASILIEKGFLPRPKGPAFTGAASLDGMAMILTPGELAAMYFSSNSEVSATTRNLVFTKAPVNLLANHLIGQSARRPDADVVRTAIMSVDADRRRELCEALSVAVKDADQVLSLPWAGELALGMTASGLRQLGMFAAVELLSTMDDMLAGNADGWESVLILSEEWHSTLADLIIAAGVMENVHTGV